MFVQLVVPQQFPRTIMKLAHESVMSRHLAVKRTIQKVLPEYIWLGSFCDLKRYCRSCDICQRTIAKGKTTRAPSLLIHLFRVAKDLVGPHEPQTNSKNKYILTLADYATRYPEAVALPSIERRLLLKR